MLKQIRNILLLSTIVLLIAGCSAATATPTMAPTSVPATMAVDTATLAPTATAVATTVAAPTETQIPPTKTPVPATKMPVATTVPGAYNVGGTPIQSTSSIVITNIQASGDTKAQVTWTTTKGFRIYYSTSFKNPFFDGYAWYGISDTTARSAYVDGKAGTTYYYRICQYNGSNCDFYSNSYTFTYPGPTVTP
jgi:hypothetical protein